MATTSAWDILPERDIVNHMYLMTVPHASSVFISKWGKKSISAQLLDHKRLFFPFMLASIMQSCLWDKQKNKNHLHWVLMQRVELKVVPLKQGENYSIYNSFRKMETLQSLPLPTIGSALCSVVFDPGGPGKKAFFCYLLFFAGWGWRLERLWGLCHLSLRGSSSCLKTNWYIYIPRA